MDQLAEYFWSHFGYSPLITRGSAGKAHLVTILLLSTCHPWMSWQSTAGHTSVTLHLSPMAQLAEHSWSYFCYSPVDTRVSAGRAHWSHFGYSPLTTRGSAGSAQLVTLLLLSTHHPCINWQITAGHTSVMLHSSLVDQLGEHNWSHFDNSPLNTRVSARRVQLVKLLLLSTNHPWISRQSTAGHTSVTLHSSPVDQLADHSWSHFCYSPLITRGSAGRVQLVTLLLLSTYHPWISWQSTAGHTSVTLNSSPVDQLAEYSWSHFCNSPLITRGSTGRAQLVTLLLLSSHHPWVSWQSTTGHTSITLHSTPVCQLEEYSWSNFCYSPLITRGSAGKAQLVTLLLLSTRHPWISWQITAGHSSVILLSSPVDQLAEHSWSHFCYSPVITRGSAGRAQLVTLLLLSSHHPWISWQITAGHTSVTLHSSRVDQLAEYSWSHFCNSPLITRGSTGRAQLVTLLLFSSHHPWASRESTAGHTSVFLHSSPVDQLAEYSWSHFCYSPLITRGSAGRAQLVTLLLLSTHHPWISWQSTAGHTSVTLHLSPVDQLAVHSWSHFCYSPLITRASAGRVQLVTLL